LSVSVLVDHNLRWEGSGAKAKRILEPPSPEKMKVIRDLVAAVAGVQAERGDQLIVESLPFETTLAAEPPSARENPQGPAAPVGFTLPALDYRDPKVWIGAGAAVVLLFGGVGVWMFLRRKRGKKPGASVAATPPALEAKADVADSLQKQLEGRLAEQAAERELQAQEVLASLKLPPVKTKKTEVLAKQLADEVRKDPQAMAHVLRSLLNEKAQ
jgi:flagellar M-ring protein FliF